jgi:translocation and assembly module TamB
VHIYVERDGSTNLPRPQSGTLPEVFTELLRLKIGSGEIAHGRAEIAGREFPFAGRIDGLDAVLRYAASPARYESKLTIARVDAGAGLPFGVDATLALEANRLRVANLRVTAQTGRPEQNWIALSGSLEDFAHPSAAGIYRANVDVLGLPKIIVRTGSLSATGDWRWRPEGLEKGRQRTWLVTARGRARGVEFPLGGRPARIDVADLACEADWTGLRCGSVRAGALAGSFQGTAKWSQWNLLDIAGAFRDVEIQRLRPLLDIVPPAWIAHASGNAQLTAKWTGPAISETVAKVQGQIAPDAGAWPLSGHGSVQWLQSGGRVMLDSGDLTTPATHVTVSGELDRALAITVASTDDGDLERLMQLVVQRDQINLPAHLEHGSINVEGTLSGPSSAPAISAQVHATNVSYEKVLFEELRAGVQCSSTRLGLKDVLIRHAVATATGSLDVGLTNWRLTGSSRIGGDIAMKRADLGTLERTLKLSPGLAGIADADIRFQGTFDSPEATVHIESPLIEWRGERIENVHGDIRFHSGAREVFETDLIADGASIKVSGHYDHASGTWLTGRLEFESHLSDLAVSKVENLMSARPGLDGTISADIAGTVQVTNKDARPEPLSGHVAMTNLTLGGTALGSVEAEIRPAGAKAEIQMNALLEGARVSGSGTLAFDGDELLEGKIEVPRLPLRLLRIFTAPVQPGRTPEPLPVRGFVEGSATLHVPLAKPDDFNIAVEIDQLQLRPRTDQILDTQFDPSDLTVRNSGPIKLQADRSGFRVVSAKLTAKETELTLSGGIPANVRSLWNIRIEGNINLAVLGNFNPDLRAAGRAKVDAMLRGESTDPQLSGRMAITDASLSMRDVPNGIEHANGTVYFEKNRANIEGISGQTGSGTFQLSGFVAFGDASSFRLQGRASNVRVRYPEGVSTLLDADLTLVGSPAHSVLSGALTIARSGFSTQTDLAGILAQSGSPVPLIATDNEFLRNIQFDVRIRSTPNATLISQYTQDIEADADLRLRGSLIKPVLLGRLQVHQGTIQLFGNRYTVSRGALLFYSTATLAPSVDLDLETRVRGVTVYIAISGPLSRLKVNYRSDPPLQPGEIIALLTTGRTPATQSTALPTAQGAGNPALPEDTTNSLLGGALSGAVSERVEKFFGASRIKIDPQVTGVDNIPQARVTIEQSISRDVTLTFVTSLNRAQQQVVQLEWDVSREWSLIAIRDESGVFGVDFVLKKRFK